MAISKNKKQKKTDVVTVGLKNFGPITSGNIEIKPLTIFIGPNNAGKTYAAMLISSLYQTVMPVHLGGKEEMNIKLDTLKQPTILLSFKDIFKDLLKGFMSYKRKILALKTNDTYEIPYIFVDKLHRNLIKKHLKDKFTNQFNYLFGCSQKDLIKYGKQNFNLELNLNNVSLNFKYYSKNIKILETKKERLKVVLKKTRNPSLNVTSTKDGIVLNIGKDLDLEFERGEAKYLELYVRLLAFYMIRILFNLVKPSYYLPAARSGMLQNHRVLTSSLIKQLPLYGTEKYEIADFSGSLANFLASIVSLPSEKGPMFKLAEDFENEIIGGEVIAKKHNKYGVADIKYRYSRREIPLNRASSTVSELAPLILYLKYLIRPNDVLIIEEPEAHLHPENQRILAKYLVRLIRKNVNVLMTTHSDYLLEQLSSFMLLKKVGNLKRVRKYGYKKDDYLNPEEIAPYVFNFDRRSNGYKINEVEVSEDYGIAQDEFIRIQESLYGETTKIRKDLNLE